MPDTILFAGPSAWGVSDALIEGAGILRLPPVQRGDVERAVALADGPGVLIVCDGIFQVAPAVSHAELCEAIDAGWQVWGVSSLGAIRAWELRHEGMRGFGEVYAMFERFDDFTDDEMCLLHFPAPPWFPVSEALVNLRHAFDVRGRELGIGEDAANAVIAALRPMWFGERTPERIRGLMVDAAGIAEHGADQLLAWLTTHRVKTTDLERLLAMRPWQDLAAPARTP